MTSIRARDTRARYRAHATEPSTCAISRLILACALAACAPAAAQSAWSPAALDDLEALAASAPLERLPEERAALKELARFKHLANTDPAADARTDTDRTLR